MTAETSNARGEWVLVPRVPSAGMWDSAESAMIESECAYNAGDPAARSDAHGFPTMRIWQAVVGYRAMLAAAPQPPSAPVELRNAILDALNLVHADGMARVESATAEMADRLAALAQQPAATAAKDAEIEALRAEVAAVKESLTTELRLVRGERDRAMQACETIAGHLAKAEARAERLAEALRAEIPVLRRIAGFGNMSDEMTEEVAGRLESALNLATQENDDA